MNHDLTLCVTVFGSHPKWVGMLEVWLKYYLKSGCRMPVVVITDHEAVIRSAITPPGVHVMRFDPTRIPGIRRDGQAFDTQGSLICQAIRVMGRCVVMDTDALIFKDPTREFAKLPVEARMGMAADAGGRSIDTTHGTLSECNGGVLYFGDDTVEGRESIVADYARTFNEARAAYEANPLLEQVAWSVLWHRLKAIGQGCDIPRCLNWSHFWPMNEDVLIRHEHGGCKWHRVEGGRYVG